VVSNLLTRREASTRLFSVLAAMGLAERAAAITEAAPAAGDEISRTCECIHQEVVINASPARVYQALVDPKQFSKVTDFVLPGDRLNRCQVGESPLETSDRSGSRHTPGRR
jgi:hypothetical protein